MELESAHSIRHPATLHLLGHAPASCDITHLSPAAATLEVDTTAGSAHLTSDQPQRSIKVGDLAELHVTVSGNKLKIKASVDSKRGNVIKMSYLNPQEASVRQLANWFSQPAKPSTGFTSEAGILKEIEDISLRQIGGLLDIFLEHTDDRLLSLAEVATNNDQQNKLFEVKSELRQHQQEIHQLCCNQIRSQFANPRQSLPRQDATAQANPEKIELIDLEAFEDWLSLEVILRRAREKYYIPLACLEKRFSKLLRENITEEQLPFGIDTICHALHDTLKNYTINTALLPIIYRLFDETVISQLEDLYDTLNAKFKSYSVLPNIESQVLRESRQLPKGAPVSPLLASTAGQATTEQGLPNNVVPINNSENLFNTVKDLINILRGPSAEVTPQQAPAVDPQQLLDGLSTLQHDTQAIEAIADGESVETWLGKTANVQLGGELADLVRLIESVFHTLNDYPQISEAVIKKLKRLQIPMVKMALIDSSFFTAADHPAKQLMNQLIELCVNSEMPNRSLETKIDSIIADINDNFQQDTGVFEHALGELSSIAKTQDNAYARNTERVAQTYEGRQRVKKAQQAVDKEIQRRVSPPQAPAVILELLDNGWRELLKLTYIKMGPDSESWREHLDTLDQLLVWVGEYEGEKAQAEPDTERELEADSFADLLAQELSNVFPGDYRYQGTVEKIRDTLKGKHPIEMVAIESDQTSALNAPNDLQKELDAANPQLARWFKRAKSLHVGDEFSYLGDETGQSNIKLAWVSENQQHFVFVNNRGQKVFDYDLVDLANELSKGLSPVEEQSEWPLVERSLYSTVQQAYEKLAYKSTHDELTGLVNRKECERLLNDILIDAKNNWQHHCLLYADIDNFSLTNSLHGHVAGDQLLNDLSRLLQDIAPENTVIGRMAGNEFIILLERRDLAESQRIAEELLRKIEEHTFNWQEYPVNFTASMGSVVINKYTENVVDLIRNAISACQAAKKSGGNRVVEYRQDAEVHSRREKLLSWIDKLNNVLSSDRLQLRAQSIAALNESGAATSHYEILLGIRNEKGELESPVEFIEAAECYNRMQRVDRWVIEKSFQWLSTLAEMGKSMPAVSINLSGNSLNDDLFMDFILEQFAKYKVPTANLCFEVTETATINNLAEAADFIREIKKIGCKFSLDDFGSGNASYQYLKHLPVDYLKIDGMFVREIDKNPNDYALVKSINEIAHLMGKKTIAEFAESQAIIDILREIGVDYVQGYAISRPTPLADIQIP